MSATILITGGSSGIGFALSTRLAARGNRLLWVSRTEGEIEAGRARLVAMHPGVQIDAIAMDLAEGGAGVRAAAWALDQSDRIDVAVNNAGFGAYGPSTSIAPEREQAMVRVNVLALHALTRALIPAMESAGGGTIVNIASNSAYQPAPGLAVYAATKAFVKHYSQALAQELKTAGSPVRILTVCPAAAGDTAFSADAGMEGVRTFTSLTATTAEEIADDILRGLDRGADFVLTGAAMRRAYWLMKFLPAPLVRALVRRELERA